MAIGATSLTESWDGPTSGGSQNHMMPGAIDEWFIAAPAGIRQAPGSVGYDEVVIRPAIAGDLTHVSGSLRTPPGLITSEWTRADDAVELTVTIPGDTTATVYIPASDGYTVHHLGAGRHHLRARGLTRYTH